MTSAPCRPRRRTSSRMTSTPPMSWRASHSPGPTRNTSWHSSRPRRSRATVRSDSSAALSQMRTSPSFPRARSRRSGSTSRDGRPGDPRVRHGATASFHPERVARRAQVLDRRAHRDPGERGAGDQGPAASACCAPPDPRRRLDHGGPQRRPGIPGRVRPVRGAPRGRRKESGRMRGPRARPNTWTSHRDRRQRAPRVGQEREP
ncbi:Uncharacterised protein [Streptococcus pneumoniae]|nr:Uncharacterised protein [Streptococcus pneumoniae]